MFTGKVAVVTGGCRGIGAAITQCLADAGAPSLRRKLRIDTRRPWFRDVVRKMRSPHTIGDECPRPGTGRFHRTLTVSDQRSGYPVPSTTPCPEGPRQRGQ